MRKDLLLEYELFDGIDRDLFPEYDKAVELIIEGKPDRSGIIIDQKKNEGYVKRLSKGPAHWTFLGIIFFGIPFVGLQVLFGWYSAQSLVFLLPLGMLGGAAFGYFGWQRLVSFTQKHMSEYVTYYEKTQAQPSPVAYQSNQPQISSDDKYSQLDKIARLKESGVLNSREFEKEKHKILNKE